MEVANVVASIISAFGNGMDLFRRMAGKKPRKRGREPTLSEEEAWLRDSLTHRPLDIQRSYHHHVSRHGHRYEIGDSMAHTSLAHTLLTLNSGLIKLINQALSKDGKDSKDNLSRRSLLSLSEMAAADTLNALSQLSQRLYTQSQLSLAAPLRPAKEAGQRRETEAEKERSKTNDSKASLKLKGGSGKPIAKKRPGPAPLLVRGGWIRPKSSSVISASSSKSSSSKSAPSKHQRSRSEPLIPATSTKKPSSSPPKESTVEHLTTIRPLNNQRSHSDLPRTRAYRQPSMLIVPSDFFLPQPIQLHTEPEEYSFAYQAAPPRPPKVPLHSRPTLPSNANPRPKSSGTMRSASTKIGEIPDRHSRALKPMGQDQEYDPRLVEYLISTPDGAVPPVDGERQEVRKRGKGFRFWKREHGQGERQEMVAAQ